jgi:hypothetical protein
MPAYDAEIVLFYISSTSQTRHWMELSRGPALRFDAIHGVVDRALGTPSRA